MSENKRACHHGKIVKPDVGGPSGSKEAAKRCTETIRTVGPTLKDVGGPSGSKEAAKRCTETIRTVGPTLGMHECRLNI
jgi:hypothetical protein